MIVWSLEKMSHKLDKLCQQLGYTFRNGALLKAALSHRIVQGDNNERLEFLGDSIVNFIIAEALYQRFPLVREGELTRLRARLVKLNWLKNFPLVTLFI